MGHSVTNFKPLPQLQRSGMRQAAPMKPSRHPATLTHGVGLPHVYKLWRAARAKLAHGLGSSTYSTSPGSGAQRPFGGQALSYLRLQLSCCSESILRFCPSRGSTQSRVVRGGSLEASVRLVWPRDTEARNWLAANKLHFSFFSLFSAQTSPPPVVGGASPRRDPHGRHRSTADLICSPSRRSYHRGLRIRLRLAGSAGRCTRAVCGG